MTLLKQHDNAVPVNEAGEVEIQTLLGKKRWVPCPLKTGTFEHLSPSEMNEVILFIGSNRRSSPNTQRRYTTELERFLVWFREYDGVGIDEWVLRDYQDTLMNPNPYWQHHHLVQFHSGVKEQTVDQYFAVIRAFVNELYEHRLLPYNPAQQVGQLGKQNYRPTPNINAFTKAQEHALWKSLIALPEKTEGQRNRKAQLTFNITFAYATGLRIDEQASHTHQDITRHDNQWVLSITGKGYKARQITLCPIAMKALKDYRRYCGFPELPQGEPFPLLVKRTALFNVKTPESKRFQSLNADSWRELFKKYVKEHVIKYAQDPVNMEDYEREWAHLTPHSLRHTRATNLYKESEGLLEIRDFLGHEDIKTTQRYIHVKLEK